ERAAGPAGTAAGTDAGCPEFRRTAPRARPPPLVPERPAAAAAGGRVGVARRSRSTSPISCTPRCPMTITATAGHAATSTRASGLVATAGHFDTTLADSE